MFDSKIQQIVDMLDEKFDDKVEAIFDALDGQFSALSKQAKIAIGMGLGLSIADTILLAAILVKLGR